MLFVRNGKAVSGEGPSLRQRLVDLLAAHPILATVVVGLFFAACFALLFWYVVFSGLSSSAEFIYSTF